MRNHSKFLSLAFAVCLAAGVPPEAAAPAKSYKIVAQREKGKSGGTLTFQVDGKDRFSTPFWERKPIPAGTYTKCSGAVMKTKKYDAIFIPNVKGRTGIFIHQGSKPAHSDGCLVIAKAKVQAIYKQVGKGKKNITVVVKAAK